MGRAGSDRPPGSQRLGSGAGASRGHKCATVLSINATAQRNAARSVTESLVSLGTTPGEPPFVQRSALIASKSARKATVDCCLDSKPPDSGCGEQHAAGSVPAGEPPAGTRFLFRIGG